MPAPVYRTAPTPPADTSRAVRIFATGKNNGENKFVVVTKLADDFRLNQDIESFGYITDVWGGDDFPVTSAFKLTCRNGTGIMFYGTSAAEEQTTNIYSKAIKVGELFTVEYRYEDLDLDLIFEIRSIVNY